MPKINLTPQIVKAVSCPQGQRKIDYFDLECKGLMLEVRQRGSTFYLRYQNERGKTRQLRLADAGDVSLAQARTLADKRRTQIAMGRDPAADKAELKLVPTFSDFIRERYIPFVKTYKKTWDLDQGLLRNHVEPKWGKRHLDTITMQDVISLITSQQKTHKPGSCNRLLILLRYVFNLAIKWDIPGVKSNPTKGFHLLEENNKKERYLTLEEAEQLYQAVCASPNVMLKFIVPMLILTGARKREVLDAKWADFDLERQVWRVPTTKSGKHRHIPLSDTVITLLSTIPRQPGCEWPFVNPKTGKPYVSAFCSWDTARAKAGLADVRMHDLRHTFASMLVNQGRTLYEVQHILGHTQVKTTQRYAHLSANTLLAAANVATRDVGHVMSLMPTRAVQQHPGHLLGL